MISVNPVLIVDDEAPVRRLLRRWAEAEGAEVLEASSAEQAVEVASAVALAVAFCDYHLPAKNGLWLAQHLREQQKNAAVVMATGVIDAEVVAGGLDVGAVDYLIKPFTRQRLSEALRWALFTHATRRRLARLNETDAEFQRNAANNVAAILAVIRVHDPAAHEHARRVADLTRQLAHVLGVGDAELAETERAALLHDIEAMISTDATLGASLDWNAICELPYLRGTFAIVKGIGQPYYSDDPVPLGARIIRVAEAYDELLFGAGGAVESPSQAIEILATEHVLEFDPDVLRALRSVRPGVSDA